MTRTVQLLLPALLSASAVGGALADPPATPVSSAAATPAATAAVASPAKPNPADKVVCKYDVPTGSRLGGHRTCMKKSDWDAQAAASQAAMSQRIGSGTSSH